MKKIFHSIFILFCCVTPSLIFAAETVAGFGGVASSMMTPVGIVADFIYSACLILGIGFVFASMVKYVEHRRSPLMVTMSTVVFLLFAGLVFLTLPLLSYIDSHAIPYSLW